MKKIITVILIVMLLFSTIFMLSACDIFTRSNSGNVNNYGNSSGNRPSNPAISLERAIEIAYEDLARRGINATYHSNSGMDWERGQWVWELLFRTQGERMPFIEFYINVDSGEIVKFEWDD